VDAFGHFEGRFEAGNDPTNDGRFGQLFAGVQDQHDRTFDQAQDVGETADRFVEQPAFQNRQRMGRRCLAAQRFVPFLDGVLEVV